MNTAQGESLSSSLSLTIRPTQSNNSPLPPPSSTPSPSPPARLLSPFNPSARANFRPPGFLGESELRATVRSRRMEVLTFHPCSFFQRPRVCARRHSRLGSKTLSSPFPSLNTFLAPFSCPHPTPPSQILQTTSNPAPSKPLPTTLSTTRLFHLLIEARDDGLSIRVSGSIWASQE